MPSNAILPMEMQIMPQQPDKRDLPHMGPLPGSHTARFNIFYRFLQLAVVVFAVMFMLSYEYISHVPTFYIFTVSTSLVSLWLCSLAILEMYCHITGRDIYTTRVVVCVAVGDTISLFIQFVASSMTLGVYILFSVDFKICSSSSDDCKAFMPAIVFGFISCILMIPTTVYYFRRAF